MLITRSSSKKSGNSKCKDSGYSKKYCVYWIPCVTHGELSIISGREIRKRDSIKTTRGLEFKIKSEAITKDASTRIGRVVIELTICEVGENDPAFMKNFNVRLISCNISRNGLIEFEYKLAEENHRIFDDLRNQVYDIIKEHFHIHENHNYFTSVKYGYYPSVYINLATIDNEAMVFYIEQFYTLLKEQLSQIEDDYILLEKNKRSHTPDVKKARLLFYESCENVFGQIVYYNSIFNSKWNGSCRLVPIIVEPDDDLRRMAHNFHNLVSKLYSIYRKSRSAFYISNIYENIEIQRQIKNVADNNSILIGETEKVLRASGKSNIISLCLGAISVILGVWALVVTLNDKGVNESSHADDLVVPSQLKSEQESLATDMVFKADSTGNASSLASPK